MLQPPIPIDFGLERPITNLTDGLIDIIVPHVVSIKKPKYVGGNGRGRNVNVDNGCGMDLAVIGGTVHGKTPFYKGVRSVEVSPDVTRRRFTTGVSSDAERDECRSSIMLEARWCRRYGSASALAWLRWLRVRGALVMWYRLGSVTSALTSSPASSTA
jgi:hypothetical protein